jgi:hypothetical protein
MMALSGGPAGYLAALRSESSGIADASSLFSLRELGLNSARMAIFLGYGFLLGAIPLFWGAWSLIRTASAHRGDKRAWVLILWIGPAACFYVLIHLRQHGHIFTFLPALILLAALATKKLGQRLETPNRARWLTGVLATTLAIANGAFFLLIPASLFGSQQLTLQTPSWRTITQRDQFLGERIANIRTHFDPASTVVLAGSFDFRHPDFYLREYQDTSLSSRLGENTILLPERVHTLVFFDDMPLSQLVPESKLQRLSLPQGRNILYITWESRQQVKLSQSLFEIQDR